MTKIREIIRLHEQAGLSVRMISQVTGVSRPVVSQTLLKVEEKGASLQVIQQLSDSGLKELLSGKITMTEKAEKLYSRFPEYTKELKRTGVTLQILWDEYIQENSSGLKYSQFCFHYQKWKKDSKLSMHINHKAGEKMFIDYTGQRMEITSPVTGEKRKVETFIAILPSSQLTYVEASASQNQEDFVRSTERAIRYYGGVPSVIVPDNLKSGVIKADIYEPDLNPLFADFAEYYRTTVIPARARKPKDKAHVENAVKIVYTRIFAPLRNQIFYSIEELNQAIQIKLVEYNNRLLSKMTVSRRDLFEEVEKETLISLPIYPYPLKYFQDNTTVGFNYHVELKEDKHYYSVPYLYKGKKVRIIFDDRNVAIYHDNIRIVQHQRNRSTYQYSTVKDHMPRSHRFADDWNPDKLKWWAGNIGDETHRAITHILDSKSYPEQSYKSCLGILNLSKKCGHEILNLACRKSWNMERINYRYIKEQAISIKEQFDKKIEEKQLSLLPEYHENIRGKEQYK